MHTRKIPSLLVLLSLAACDAAIVANAQQQQEAAPPAGDGHVAAVVDKAEAIEKTVDVAVKVEAQVDVKATIDPSAFDLESVSFLVKKGKVKNAAELEKKINDPKEKLNNLDIDGDGKVDKIQVVEVKKEGEVEVFELKAIPSKSKDKDEAVVVAFLHFEPDKVSKKLVVKCVYAPIFVGWDTIVYTYDVPIEVKGEKIVVVDANPFYGWVFLVDRPAFVGVYVYELSPPPVIIIDHKHWHGKHKHKGKWKGKGKWH